MTHASDWDPLPPESFDADPWNAGKGASAQPAAWQPDERWAARSATSGTRGSGPGVRQAADASAAPHRMRPSRCEDLMADGVPAVLRGPTPPGHEVMMLRSSRPAWRQRKARPDWVGACMKRAWLIPVACALFAAAALASMHFQGTQRFVPLTIAGAVVGFVWTLIPRDPEWFVLTAAAGYAAVMHDLWIG